MALILSLETSTEVCSVAVHDNTRLLATAEVHIPQSHASKLTVLVDQVLTAAGSKYDELSALAVTSGPGSFTGLRIGTSVAKGICYGLDIPLIAVSSLDVMASRMHKYDVHAHYLCPMIDAMRMEVYCELLNADLEVIYPVQSKIIDPSSFGELLEEHKILFFGNGAEKCKDVIVHPNAHFVSGIYPEASQLGVLAFGYFNENKFVDVMAYEPAYLKEFIAKKSKPVF